MPWTRERCAAALREAALAGSGRAALASLLEAFVDPATLRELAQAHGVTPKGGYRLEKAPARALANALADPRSTRVLAAACAALAAALAASVPASTGEDAGDVAAPPPSAPPPPDLAPILKLKEQELARLRRDLDKSAGVAQGLREQVGGMQRQATLARESLARFARQIRDLRTENDRLLSARSVPQKDHAVRIHGLEKELEEFAQIEEEQRRKLAEQAGRLRAQDVTIAELQEHLAKRQGRKRKQAEAPPPPPPRFTIPHFLPSFVKSLEGKDRHARERAYQAVFLFCTEGPHYPGLQVKSLDPSHVWSLRASRKLRVYFRRRADGDVDILELLDRQEQETALRRYREKS